MAMFQPNEGPPPLPQGNKISARLSLVGRVTMRNTRDAFDLKAQAWLTLTGRSELRLRLPLQKSGVARLRLASNLTIATPKVPSGLGAQMKIITDRYRPEVILNQYLQVWFEGSPHPVRVTLKIDDGAEFQPAFTWQNPGVIRPAVIQINRAEIPGDGLTHRVTVSVWQQGFTERRSARNSLNLYAKTPNARTVEAPAWCGATLIRQSTPELGDLTRIQWRHRGAVQIFARFRVLNAKKTAWINSTASIGYGDYDEDTFNAEDIGLMLVASTDHVSFGVAAIQHGQFGVITWASPVVLHRRIPNIAPVVTPDSATARNLTSIGCKDEIGKAIFAENGWSYPVYLYPETVDTQRRTIIQTAMDKLLLRIKDITHQGGAVTLDDLGRFEARWNEARTVRSVAFVSSPGFSEGARAGRVMTDAEAKAA